VAGDVKQGELAEKPALEMYTPFVQAPWPFIVTIVRTQADPLSVAASLRAALTKMDPDQPVGDIKTLSEYVARSSATPQFTAVLVGGFAVMALLLAGVGLFSVMAYSVAQRGREIGIRMALGAQAADVRGLVVSQALRMGLAGLALGVAGAFATTRVLSSLLFGVSAGDPLTFAAVCALLLGVVLLAAYLPARRATRVDPIVALRMD
jgi:ABC-type antimicrobial peptide transport system permease subunit